MKIRPLFGLVIAAFFLCGSRGYADLILNGGFETGTFANWTDTPGSTFDSITNNTGYVHSGSYGAQLGAFDPGSVLSQSFSTVVGQKYDISFWLYTDPDTDPESDPSSASFSAQFDSNTPFVSLVNPSPQPYTQYATTVTATSTTSTINFAFDNGDGYFGLDDVSVVTHVASGPPGVPEPSSVVALFGLGAMGLFLVARRKFAA
jgi:hypothetical protein